MKIEKRKNKIMNLEYINDGDCFIWNNQMLIKTTRCSDDETILCVRLMDGYVMDLNVTEKCEVLSDAKIIFGD